MFRYPGPSRAVPDRGRQIIPGQAGWHVPLIFQPLRFSGYSVGTFLSFPLVCLLLPMSSILPLSFSVRIEILRSLSQRVTSSQLLTYCVSNGPRPKLSVGPANGFPGRRTALFFAEALRRYGYMLEEDNLEKAYDRAQMFFTGVSLFLCFGFSI